jgi:hypothetical protein
MNTGQKGDRLPILSLDFDGVIHDYGKGWQNGRIYGDVTPGFFEWAMKAKEKFTLVIHSSRANSDIGCEQIIEWLEKQADDKSFVGHRVAQWFTIQAEKPPALLTIDDRCVRFDGDWADPKFDPEELRRFKPWMNWSAT